jgi:ABC-type sugar transport system permease subunit
MVVAMAAVPTALGLVLAAALFDFVGKHFGSRVTAVLRACFYLPQVLPIAVAGIVWSWILAPESGSLNELLKAAGLGGWQQDWLGDPDLALYTVMAVMVWVQLGFPLVVSGGHSLAQAPSHLLIVPLSAWNRYSVRPLPSTRTLPSFVLASATEPLPLAGFEAVDPPP